jgi:hypothetical protein
MAAIIANVSGVNTERIVLTSNSSLNIIGGYDGQLLNLIIQQDATGSRTLSYTNVPNGTTVNATANNTTSQLLTYNVVTGNWGFYAVALPAGG